LKLARNFQIAQIEQIDDDGTLNAHRERMIGLLQFAVPREELLQQSGANLAVVLIV